MTTKERILNEALRLFSERGYKHHLYISTIKESRKYLIRV